MPTWLAGTIAAGVIVVTALAALGGWAAGARWAALRARGDAGGRYAPLTGDGNSQVGLHTRNVAFNFRAN
jgi:hypothetical protein